MGENFLAHRVGHAGEEALDDRVRARLPIGSPAGVLSCAGEGNER
jgi:hypothetical protein